MKEALGQRPLSEVARWTPADNKTNMQHCNISQEAATIEPVCRSWISTATADCGRQPNTYRRDELVTDLHIMRSMMSRIHCTYTGWHSPADPVLATSIATPCDPMTEFEGTIQQCHETQCTAKSCSGHVMHCYHCVITLVISVQPRRCE